MNSRCVLMALVIFYGIWFFINKMNRAYKCHKLAFSKDLQVLLNHIGGDNINYLQFQLLKDQLGLLFIARDQQTRCLSLFKKYGFISKKELCSTVALVGVAVKHCKRQYFIRLRPTSQEIHHCGNRCFEFWMGLMRQKYGTIHIWFQQLCQEPDIRRVSIQRFLKHLTKVLKGTLHESCAQKISMKFEKSKRNELQFSVFMNTILINRKLLSKNSTSRQSKDCMTSKVSSPGKGIKTETRQTQSLRNTVAESHCNFQDVRKATWSVKAKNRRYTSPLKSSMTIKTSTSPSFS